MRNSDKEKSNETYRGAAKPDPLLVPIVGPVNRTLECHAPWRHNKWARYLNDRHSRSYFAKPVKEGVRKFYMPRMGPDNISMAKTNIVEADANLTTIFDQRDGSKLYYNAKLAVGGIFIRDPSAGALLLTGGCMVGVISTPKGVLFMHVSRNSLIDIADILDDEPFDPRPNIIDRAVCFLEQNKIAVEESVICGSFSLPQEVFEHPEADEDWGALNRKFFRYFDKRYPEYEIIDDPGGRNCLSLNKLFMAHAKKYPFMTHSVSDELPVMGPHVHTRLEGERKNQRNLTILY